MGHTKVIRLSALQRVLAALAAVLLGGTLLAAPPAQAAPEQVLTASPTKSDNRAVRDTHQISIEGTGPEGSVTGVRLLGLRADGSLVGAQQVGDSALRGDPQRDAFVRNDGGTITGRFGLGCMFGPSEGPGGPCPLPTGQARSVQVEVTLSTGDVLTSSLVPVDFTDPTIRGYRVVAPNTIEVLFSEPVRHEQGDSPLDWSVTDPLQVVEEVESPAGDTCRPEAGDDTRLGLDSCVRLLRLTSVPGLPEDAQPRVEHAPALTRLGALYEDFTDNGLDRSDATGSGARGRALDVVRPAIPSITGVAGKSPSSSSQVLDNDTTPLVRITGATPGHQVRVLATSPTGAESAGARVVVRDDGTADVPAPILDQQGRHQLLVEAADPHGNLSTETSKAPARDDGSPNPVAYVLDTAAPVLASARSVGGTSVDVTFTESILPDGGDPADWTITTPQTDGTSTERTPTAVSGSGAERRLSVSDVPGGAVVRYSGTRYADEASNVVPNGALEVGGIALPRVTVPDSRVFTAQTQYTVRGTAEPDRLIEVFRSGSDGRPEGDRLASQQLTSGQTEFAVSVPLVTDEALDLVVVASDGAATSPPAAVPTITQDARTPALELTAPTGGEVYAGNQDRAVTWSYQDANPGLVAVELSLDGGKTWSMLSPGEPATAGSFAWRTPAASTETARIRLTSDDKAGNRSEPRVSAPFVIDAVLPRFNAVTTAPRTVQITFSEPVFGELGRLTDWRVAGQQASVTAADNTGPTPEQADGTTTLTLTSTADFGPDGEPEVAYVPAGSAVGQELRDRAEQSIDVRAVTALDGIRPAVPSIEAVDGQEPANNRVSGDDPTPSVSVSGLVPDNTVWVERVPSSGTPERGPATTSTGDAAVLQAPALADGSHVLRVVAQDPTGNLSTETDKQPGSDDGGPNPVTYVLDTTVPTVPADVTAPALTLRAPTGGELLAGGAESTVAYTTSDESPGRLLAEISTNGGSSWTALGTVNRPADGDGELDYTVPDVDTEAARVRVTAVDAAGNSTQRVSGTFVIDAIAPAFTALTTSPTTVRITFSEPVSGPVAPGDFRVDGQPARASEIDRPGSTPSSAAGARTLLLTVATAFDGDATPSVTYAPTLLGQLVDRVGQGVVERVVTAVDGIRPPVPTLSAVDGKLPSQGRVSGENGAPDVVVSGLVSGHTVRVDRLAGGQTVATGAPVPVDSSQETARAPRMTSDGEYELLAVAVDPAGNLSTDTGKTPASPDGGPSSVVYALDLPQQTPVRDVTAFACPPDQVEPAGFVDTEGSTFRFEIDCLAAYGFTKGVTADRYAPAENVTRAQMAIFVSRLARYGSVPLDTRDAGFTDLGAATQEARDAINALANLGVVKGVSPGRYDPASKVSRAQMASFLARLQPAVGQPFPSGANAFDDDAGNVHEANIDAIAAAGIVQGVSPRQYAPGAAVTRQQMAGFLIRYVDGRIEAGEMDSVYR